MNPNRTRTFALLAVGAVVLVLLLAACGDSSSGLPAAPGRYTLKEKSIGFDGERYAFFWADAAGQLHRASSSDVKLQLDEENYLEITADKKPVLHLKQDEPVTVEGRDQAGDFGSFWYPFLIGSMLSRGGGPVIVNQPAPREFRDPTYRYPPTSTFDRGDTIGGSVATSRPGAPDYNRMPPVGDAVSGQTGGAGGGNAALGRSSATTAGGQAGGTGSGSAALNKSGAFRAGPQGYNAKVESGQIKPITGGSGTTRVGGGSGALDSKPSISTGRSNAPSVSRPSTGGSVPRISTGRRR